MLRASGARRSRWGRTASRAGSNRSRSSRSWCDPRRLGAALALLVLLAARPAAADDTVDYVVRDGDTCIGIAIRELGDRAAYREIHRLNPQLGKEPHHLVAGEVLKLPRTERTPDAQVTRTLGSVRVQRPAVVAWDDARRGMDLYSAWKVGSERDASAELTFHNDSRLRMREQTIVIIYGPTKAQSKTIAVEADLESGTLETRLGELGSQVVAVRTPSAEAELGMGRAVLAIARDGASLIANHGGAAVAVRGRKKHARRGKAVQVAAGMGSRVRPGKAPEPPRPLPPTPAWAQPAALVVGVGPTLRLAAAWAPVAQAARYRVAIETDAGDAVAALEVPASSSPAFELPGAAPGRYQVTVSSIDADGFESVPSPALPIDAAVVALTPPGASEALAAPAADADGRVPVARGATVAAGAGVTCHGDAGAALDRPGAQVVTCTADATGAGAELAVAVEDVTIATAAGGGVVVAPGAAEVTLAVASGAPVGATLEVRGSPGLTVTGVAGPPDHLAVALVVADDAPAAGELTVIAGDVVLGTVAVAVAHAEAPPPPPAPPPPAAPARASLGVYLGVQVYPRADGDVALGNAHDPSYRLADAPLLGLRASYRHRPWLELEVAAELLPSHFAGAPDAPIAGALHADAALRVDRGCLTLRVLAGVGGHALLTKASGADRDVDDLVEWGAALELAPAHGVRLRVDARHQLAVLEHGLPQGAQLTAGLVFDLDR